MGCSPSTLSDHASVPPTGRSATTPRYLSADMSAQAPTHDARAALDAALGERLLRQTSSNASSSNASSSGGWLAQGRATPGRLSHDDARAATGPAPALAPLARQASGSGVLVLPPFPPGLSFAVSHTMCMHKGGPEGKWFETEHSRYRIQKTLGRGSQARVKLCECIDSGELYAAKFYTRQSLVKRRTMVQQQGSSPLEDLHREVVIMGRLRDKHVVTLREVIDDPAYKDILLITEFVSGGALMKGTTTCEPMPEREARRYFEAMVSGLLVCHQNGVLHRDVKPENLFRTEGGGGGGRGGGAPALKLGDFGVASCFRPGGSDMVTSTVGTAAFHAPECFTSRSSSGGYSGCGADAWAAGVTLYQMVFGHCPFMAGNLMEIYRRAREEQPDFGRQSGVQVSASLQELLAALLEKDPRCRLQLRDALRHPWVRQQQQKQQQQQQHGGGRPSGQSAPSAPSHHHRRRHRQQHHGGAPPGGVDAAAPLPPARNGRRPPAARGATGQAAARARRRPV
jgi:serine/threonine protein kinase